MAREVKELFDWRDNAGALEALMTATLCGDRDAGTFASRLLGRHPGPL
jgi:hypothetical protein